MKTKLIIAGLLITIGAGTLLVAIPALADPLWDNETEEYYPWWDTNKTYPMPHWDNETYIEPMWINTEAIPYYGEDGYCPGPIWGDPDGDEPEGRPWRSCGGMRGYGGRGSGARASRWTG